MHRTPIFFVLTPHFLLLDYAGPAEAFRIAAGLGAPFDLHTISPTATLISSLGLEISNLAPLPQELPSGALVILCGVMKSSDNYQLPEAQAVVDWLHSMQRPDLQVACICSAAQLAARAGLLDGRRCTTHHTLIERLRQQAPKARVEDDKIFIQDGPIYSSAGITAGIDLALFLIEQLASASIAQEVARHMVIYLRRNGQEAQLSPWLAHRSHLHPSIHRVQDAISHAPEKHWSVADLAAIALMSERNLSRLFRQHAGLGMVEYQQSLRIAHAKKLLENPSHSLEKIAELAGFNSIRDFRRVWAKFEVGLPRR
ncbi:helix-turn-helix domain-containing protein [Iodobacter sp. CM08]|uniref:GlxA family transcriptional regulator n=1 Tax=Iodobacter sp. CM08 TaxID=3085902 RepID=UPI002981E7F9|nr:helix-turn-helix domain-containing protein [Iodobacter sp. CM08]MDW5417757.1 helix-turn-helix domain-containing protein [Iodobacter sp. CM08]